MIGTHNSGTGEKSKHWYHNFLIPFARCQRYTIKEQLEHGCKLFDLRIRSHNGFTKYYLCHGIWESEMTLDEALKCIHNYGVVNNCVYNVLITYEGNIKNIIVDWFENIIKAKVRQYYCIHLVQLAVKKPKWFVIYSDNRIKLIQGYKCLDFSSWHTFIPIPWLWSKFYTKSTESDDTYILIDFL